MYQSKAWNWTKNDDVIWLHPSEESYYLLDRWKIKGYNKFLDLGCGLGRHSIFFAKNNFEVVSFDLSSQAIEYLKNWSNEENLNVSTYTGDMIELPFEDNYFECLLAYHVISHSNTAGVRKVIAEVQRVLKPGCEFYLTLCSKNSSSYKKDATSIIDENTLIKEEDGPEKGIPHFYTDLELIKKLFNDFELIRVRHIQDYKENLQESSWHYFIHGFKKL